MKPTIHLPPPFIRTMNELYGAKGKIWLTELPTLLKRCEQRWSIRVMPPFPNLSYNYVAPARTHNGKTVVLKAGVPNRELTTEIEALRLYNAHRSVRLLDADANQGILLLEHLQPGTPLSQLDDDEAATSIAADIMQHLWCPVPSEHPFPTVHRWAGGLQRLRAHFDGGTGPLPSKLVAKAESLFTELISSMTENILLHGDLHHDNILTAQRHPWLAIDPKGLVGEPAYDVGAFLRNPGFRLQQATHPERLLARRVELLAEKLGLERERLIGWGIAQAVLSAWWSIEDHGHGWEFAVACAEWLEGLEQDHRIYGFYGF